jgi:hypothetical protein
LNIKNKNRKKYLKKKKNIKIHKLLFMNKIEKNFKKNFLKNQKRKVQVKYIKMKMLGKNQFHLEMRKIIIFSEIIKNRKLSDLEKVFGMIMKVLQQNLVLIRNNENYY